MSRFRRSFSLRWASRLACVALLVAAPLLLRAETLTLTHGYFKDVQIERPPGEVRQFVMLFGDGEQGLPARPHLPALLAGAGTMVARIDMHQFYRALEAGSGECTSATGTIENLSRHVQAYVKLPTYLTPILVGQGAGASFVYSMAVQAQPDALVAAISLGFCPQFAMAKPLCSKENGLRMTKTGAAAAWTVQPSATLAAPWLALQSDADRACGPAAARPYAAAVPSQAAVAALGRAATESSAAENAALLAALHSFSKQQTAVAPPPASLADLPIVEVPLMPRANGSASTVSQGASNAGRGTHEAVVGAAANNRRFAILLSGDGGWAGIDKGIAASLVERGIPVAGFDSLRYFWTRRTPEGLATDIDRMIRFYAARWGRSEALLIGYSQGADVLPFALNKLPAAARKRIHTTALLGLGQNASFEFHVTNWLGPSGDRPITPEATRLRARDVLCVYGTKEPGSLCPSLSPSHVDALQLPGDHHFNGDHDRLASAIVDHADKRNR